MKPHLSRYRLHNPGEEPNIIDGKIVRIPAEDRRVIVMAVVGIYAMVRRPREIPYVALVKELREIEP